MFCHSSTFCHTIIHMGAYRAALKDCSYSSWMCQRAELSSLSIWFSPARLIRYACAAAVKGGKVIAFGGELTDSDSSILASMYPCVHASIHASMLSRSPARLLTRSLACARTHHPCRTCRLQQFHRASKCTLSVITLWLNIEHKSWMHGCGAKESVK